MNIVYKYENLVNGKLYIGRTSQTLSKRANGSGLTGYKTSERFWNAICKYGPENFKGTILFENLTFEESVRIESELIKKYDIHMFSGTPSRLQQYMNIRLSSNCSEDSKWSFAVRRCTPRRLRTV